MSALGLGEAAKHATPHAADFIKASPKPIATGFAGAALFALHFSIITVTGLAAYVSYWGLGDNWSASEHLGAILTASVLTVSILHWSGAYDEDRSLKGTWGLRSLLSSWAVAFALLLAVAFAFKISDHFSRIWAFSWFSSASIVLAIGQIAGRQFVSRLAQDGRFASRTVIVGAGEHGQKLAAHLQESGDPLVRLLGFIDDRSDRIPASSNGCQLLGDCSHLIRLVQMGCVDQVLIALPWGATDRVLQLVRRLATTPVNIRLAPDLVGFEFAGRGYSHVAQLPMLQLFDRPISGWGYLLKTIEDRVLAFLGLVFLVPLFAIVSLAIKLDSRGPVFFRQKRYGFNNQLFSVWKFRTMYAEMADPNCEVQTTRGDPRVTRVGRFLRRSSIDELPQLFNVLFGDMSIVGPRPHPIATKAEGRLFEEVVDSYAARHRVKPGITGWAQINGFRGETDTAEKIQKRVEHDLYYIDNWSIWLDLSIILRTILILWSDDNAY